MKETNDQKILALKKQIEEKKKQIDKSKRFAPITTCSLELEGVRYNLHTLSKEQMTLMLIRLNMYVLSAKDLGVSLKDCIISGYHITDWISDIQAKLDHTNQKEEEAKLKAMESKLDQLLSEDKKTELALSEIENMLK